ncbi:MAG: hypothetical protein AMXMBFR83_05600 [Phycisphaerae bacterium]
MTADWSRRRFLETAGAAAVAGAATGMGTARAAEETPRRPIRVIGLCASPRKGKTTAAAMRACLEAARQAGPQVEVELIELAGLKINGAVAAGVPLEPGERDDFPAVAEKLADPQVAGIIVGTPVYFGNMSSLCKAFLERCIALRKNDFALRNKVAGVLAVGGSRNGGQELTIQSVLAALLSQDMIVVGDGKPTAHSGAALWNNSQDNISSDEAGLATARNLGRRVAEVAAMIARAGA